MRLVAVEEVGDSEPPDVVVMRALRSALSGMNSCCGACARLVECGAAGVMRTCETFSPQVRMIEAVKSATQS